MKRRTFLRGAAAAMAAVPAFCMLQGCDAYSRGDQLDAWGGGPLLGRIGSRLAEALRLAALAPSGHNTQPWTVRIDGRTEWVIGSDRSRWLPEVDPHNRELLLSIGAFLENFVVAARNWGHEVEYRVIGRHPEDTELVALRLRMAPVVVDGIDAMRRRRCLRKDFETRELRAADLAYTTRGLEGFQYFPCASREARYLAEASVEATKAQVARDAAQAELARWIRWSDEEAQLHLNGLTPASMEIEGLSGWYVRNFYSADDVMTRSFRARSVDNAAEQARNCGGWMVLSGAAEDVAGLIEAGRVFERFFLRVRDRRIAVHPMSQALEEQPWQAALAREVGAPRAVQYVLRVGYRDPYPPPVSLRMPLSAFARA